MEEFKDKKIAIAHDFLTKIGGAEKVLLVLHELFPDAPIYTTVYDEERTKNVFSGCKIITSSLNKLPRAIRNRTKLLLPFLPRAVEEFDFSEFDIVISSSNSFIHGVITSPKTFHLCYCHSPMRYAWDYTNEYLKENKVGFGLKGLFVRNILHKVRIWDKISSPRADSWIANSENVKTRIKKYYNFDSKVLFPPAPVENISMNNDIADEYYLIVSRLEPYKKIELAISAFNDLKKPLIIIGEGSYFGHLKAMAHQNIEFLGWQSNKSVYEYMRNARALIFPGEDDAGITPLESMACGRPVIAYNRGGAKECILQGKTGLLFDKPTSESLKENVLELEKNILDFSPKSCRERAEEFSTENFKSNFIKILKEEYSIYMDKMSDHVKN